MQTCISSIRYCLILNNLYNFLLQSMYKLEIKGLRQSTITTTPPFFGQIKIRVIFLWDKLLEFLLFNEVLKNLIFFHLPIKRIGFITLIMSKFQILKAYLYLIYRKRVEIIVYTFIFEFWEINFFELLRPSRTSVQGNFGFLTFKYALNN